MGVNLKINMFKVLIKTIGLMLPFFILFENSKGDRAFILLLTVLLVLIYFINKTLFSFLAIYISISGILISHIFFKWGLTPYYFDSILEIISLTNLEESLQYFQYTLSINDLFIFLYYSFLVFLGIHLNKTIVFKLKKKIILFFLSLTIIFSMILLAQHTRHNYLKSLPLGLITSVFKVLNSENLNVERNLFIKKNRRNDQIKNEKLLLNYDKVVVVLGESVNKKFMSIYNNRVMTTPFLSKIKDSIIIMNSISPASQTHLSIPIMYTDITYQNFNSFYKSNSFITDFRNFGYQTFWISNQDGINDDTYGKINSIARESDNIYFANMSNSTSFFDEILLEKIQESVIPQKKQLFNIHLMGSHYNYKQRYPREKALHKRPNNLTQEYENSIFYTDSILKQIFKIFKSEKLLIVYTSDHGEVVSEIDGGHGFYQPYKDEFEVPLVFFSSIKNDRIFKQKKLINNESFYNLIKYICGLDDNLNLSNSKKVISFDPSNINDFCFTEYK